jgi:hypothetical protein
VGLEDEIAWLDRCAQAQGGHLRRAYARVGSYKRGMPLSDYLIRKVRSAVRPRELMGERVAQHKREVAESARTAEQVRSWVTGTLARIRADREVGRG